MSAAGRKKQIERLSKRAKREMLVPYDKMTPHDQKRWDRGVAALRLALQGRHVPS